MGDTVFNEMELDAIGEIMNISLGASATAVSTMLGTSTNITTPKVSVQSRSEFVFKEIEPAVGVEIQYVEGLSGKNVIMFSREDVRIIVGMMMGMEIPPEEFELDEMNQSAIREVMNQMMGSSATALSEFLGYRVDISTPVSFEIANEKVFKDKYFSDDKQEVVVRFSLEIGDELSSEFLNIMSMDLVKKLLEPYADTFSGTGDGSSVTAPGAREIPLEDEVGGSLLAKLKGQSEEAVENAKKKGEMEASSGPAPAPAPDPAPSSGGGGKALSQAEMDALMASMKGGGDPAPAPAPADRKSVV